MPFPRSRIRVAREANLISPNNRPNDMLLPAAVLFIQQGLFGLVIPEPTGRNGYEEYVKAAVMVNNTEARTYADFTPSINIKHQLDTPPSNQGTADYDQVLRTFLGKTPLQIRRDGYERFGGALELVRQGNGKDVWSPRTSYDESTLFPELSPMRTLGKLMVGSADSMFADGRSTQATETLLDGLVMSRNIQLQILISYLVGASIQSVIFSDFDSNLEHLSVSDWENVLKVVKGIEDAPNPLESIVVNEIRAEESIFDKATRDPEFITRSGLYNEFPDALIQRMKGASEAQLQDLRDSVHNELQTALAEVRSAIYDPKGAASDPLKPSQDPLMAQVVDMLTPNYQNVLKVNARTRIQFKLLELHAEIQIYRWNYFKLPAKLSDVTQDVNDPVAGTPFTYQRIDDSRYKLSTKSTPGLGDVDLRYKGSTAALQTSKGPVTP